jgi:RNA polymerase sigma-70 factor, ECF subfamily
MSILTPFSLLDRLRGPTNEQAWTCFVRLYTPLFFTWARRLGFAGEEARDRVQDLFVRLAKEMPSFVHNREGRFRGWLWTTFRNLCYEYWRRTAKANGRSVPIDQCQLEVSDNVAEWIESEYQGHLVRRAVELVRAECSATDWQAFWEYVVRDRPAAEVAEELNVTRDVVFQARSRALRKLRKLLAQLLD